MSSHRRPGDCFQYFEIWKSIFSPISSISLRSLNRARQPDYDADKP